MIVKQSAHFQWTGGRSSKTVKTENAQLVDDIAFIESHARGLTAFGSKRRDAEGPGYIVAKESALLDAVRRAEASGVPRVPVDLEYVVAAWEETPKELVEDHARHIASMFATLSDPAEIVVSISSEEGFIRVYKVEPTVATTSDLRNIDPATLN